MAIALDTSAEVTATVSTTGDSLSFTVTGTDMVLFVSCTVESASAGLMTAASYNGVALTKISEVDDATTGTSTYLWVLSGPATGAHTLTTTFSSTIKHQTGIVSYSGAASFSGAAVDNSTTGSSNSGSTLTTTMTPNAANCWMIVAGTSGFTTTINASTGSTLRQSGAPDASIGAGIVCDTNAAVNGSSSMTITTTGNDRIRSIMASFAPAAAAGHPTMRRWGGTPFMGGQGIGQKGSGRAWGRSRISGLWLPQGDFA